MKNDQSRTPMPAQARRTSAGLLMAFLALFVLAATKPTYAYVDPGTGSLLLQTIVAVLAGGLAVFKGWRMRIGGFFRRFTGRGASRNDAPER